MKTGLTSITFRQLDWPEVIANAKACRLDGIEWGGDVHAPPGDTTRAREIHRAMQAAGLAVLSYGSYYRLGEGKPFEPVLATACALQTGMIRVWAGVKASAQYSAQERALAIKDAQAIAELANAQGIAISLEYHRNTLTDTAESAVDLLEAAGNIKTYWQPNPELCHEENLRELKTILPWLTYLHVFHWKPDGTRLALEDGLPQWREYMHAAKGHAQAAILEFTRGDAPAQCVLDAKILRSLCN